MDIKKTFKLLVATILLYAHCAYAYHITCVITPMHCAQCIENIKKCVLGCSDVQAVTAIYPQQCYCDVVIKDEIALSAAQQSLGSVLEAEGYELRDVVRIE